MSAGDLDGRVALVTGSSTGIGRAAAEDLARRGASLVSHGINRVQVEQTLVDWRHRGWRATASHVDLGSSEGAARLHAEVLGALGPIDILVLNASIELPQTLAELTCEALAAQVAVNLTANALLLQKCLPSMRARGWGRVIAIGSVQEERPNARHLFYAGCKAALTNMVLNLAKHESGPGVTLNVIRPGAIVTDRNRAVLEQQEYADAVLQRIPAGRLGTPDDCVGAVSLLCSDGGAYINGAVISADGGMRL